ncbi:hypothetical protein AVEN_66945-1, partial [Araneus ventricosus]
GGVWAFLQQQRAATPAVALLVSSGVWHIATGSDRLPLWRFSGFQTHDFHWRFDPFGDGSTAYGLHYDAHSALWQQQVVLQHTDSLVVRSQSRQNLCVPATLAARPSKGHPDIPIRLQTIRNSNPSIPLWQFSLASHTDERFFPSRVPKIPEWNRGECPALRLANYL